MSLVVALQGSFLFLYGQEVGLIVRILPPRLFAIIRLYRLFTGRIIRFVYRLFAIGQNILLFQSIGRM